MLMFRISDRHYTFTHNILKTLELASIVGWAQGAITLQVFDRHDLNTDKSLSCSNNVHNTAS